MRTGFRRTGRDEADETHRLTRLPRDFEKIESESCSVEPAGAEDGADGARAPGPRFEFTVDPADLRPPLTDWLRRKGGVEVHYHTDLEESPKGRYRLRAKDPSATDRDGWTEEPTRLVMSRLED